MSIHNIIQYTKITTNCHIIAILTKNFKANEEN